MARAPYSQLKGPGPGNWDRQAVKPFAGALSRVLQRQQVGGESCPPLSDGRPSAAIKSIDYNPQTHRLYLTFPKGRSYTYFDVPPDAYEALCDANSKGRHFNSVLRNRYAYARIG